jgi:hypothetical protein
VVQINQFGFAQLVDIDRHSGSLNVDAMRRTF